MKCYDYAMKYISRTPKSERDLKVRLLQKWFSNENIEYTLTDFKEKNFINDEQFAELYINSEVVRKGKPMMIIKQKLRQKWIDKEITKKIINKLEIEIQEWIYKKIKKDIENYKSKEVTGFDIIQKLMRKWYKLDDIKAVINKYRQ